MECGLVKSTDEFYLVRLPGNVGVLDDIKWTYDEICKECRSE